MKEEINHQASQILAYKKLFERNKKREEQRKKLKASQGVQTGIRPEDDMAASLYNLGSFGINAEEETDDSNIYRMPFILIQTPDNK